MSIWSHTYREEAIPGAVGSGVINEHRPGQKLAKAITELQEKVIADIGTVNLVNATGTIEIVDNKLNVSINVNNPEIPDPLPQDGENGDVLTKEDTAYLWRRKYPAGGREYMVLTAIPNGQDGITAKWDYVRAVELP